MFCGRSSRLARRLALAALFIVFASLATSPVWAQAGSVQMDDPDGLFTEQGAVQAAAERLAGEGVDVVVIAVRNAGADPAAAEQYLDDRLAELGLADNSRSLRGNQIVFFVAPEPEFDGIYFVGRYRAQLEPVYRQIQSEQSRPRFTTGDIGGGIIAAIDAVRTTLNPPTSPVTWVVGGVVAAGVAGAVAVPALRKRRQSSETLASARRRMEEARQAAGVAIADIGRRVTIAREKAQYDQLSYTPEDTQQIRQIQQRGEAEFGQAQAAFDAAEEAQIAQAQPTPEHYVSIATQFDEARRLAEGAAQAISDAEQRRAALDQATRPAKNEPPIAP